MTTQIETTQAVPLVVSPGRYLRRDGSIVEIVTREQYKGPYPFVSVKPNISYTAEGCCIENNYTHDFDLIERLPDAKPEPQAAIEAVEPVKGRMYVVIGRGKPVRFTGGRMVSGNYIFETATGSCAEYYQSDILREHREPRSRTVDVVFFDYIDESASTGISILKTGDKLSGDKNELARQTITLTEQVQHG